MTERASSSRTVHSWLQRVEQLGGIGHWHFMAYTGTVTLSPGARHCFQTQADTLPMAAFVAGFARADHAAVRRMLDISGSSQGTQVDIEPEHTPDHGSPRRLRLFAENFGQDGVMGFVQDVTQTRMLGDQLTHLRDRHEDFCGMANEWFWETDTDLRFTYFSRQMTDLLGLRPDSLLGKTRRDLAADRNESLELEMHLSWLDRQEPFRDFRYWCAGADGRERFVSVTGKPVFAPDGSFLGYRGTGRNITEQHEVREALMLVNRQLNSANKAKSDAATSLKEAYALLEERSAAMERVQEEVRHSALHDSLTGLANRRYLDTHLSKLATECQLAGTPLSVLHLDLDRFKEINDTMGHAAGDAVLGHVAKILTRAVRTDDFVARVGGDEFVIVRPCGDVEELIALAQNLIDAVDRPLEFDGRACRCGTSVGISVMEGGDIDPSTILTNADVALYRAKRAGRGQYAVFNEKMQRELRYQRALADGILAGLELGEFVPWYQPQISARTFELCGVEALARWQRPDGTNHTPDVFLGVAEELGVLQTIDRQIMEQALQDLTVWDAAGLSFSKLAVNVSARRLIEQDLTDGLKKLAPPRGRLVFELLESVFLDDLDDVALWNIDALKEMGIEIALDDFGSGHASIISLVRLAPDIIKIDREMTSSITTDDARRSLAASIIEIGKTLGVQVTAEGVEGVEQAELLRQMGCDTLQGYYIGKPMPAAAIPAFVERWRDRMSPDLTGTY